MTPDTDKRGGLGEGIYAIFGKNYEKLLKENKSLKANLELVRRHRDGLEEENKKLKEKVRFLEECLDKKEKVNKKLREELSAYDREYFDEDKKAKNIFIDKNGKVVSGGEFRELC